MVELPNSLKQHRVAASSDGDVTFGKVRYSPVKSLWFIGLLGAAVVGGISTFSIEVFLLFCASTAFVLLFGHSLGSHRKLVHNSFECPRWLEYCLVYCGIHVGLAGPLGILKQHELRDYAQRLPNCHPYLRHGSTPWRDAWWQLNCGKNLDGAPRFDCSYLLLDRRMVVCILGGVRESVGLGISQRVRVSLFFN